MMKQDPNLLVDKLFFSTGHTSSQVVLKMFHTFSMFIITATIYFKILISVILNFFKVCFVIEFLSTGYSYHHKQ